MSSNLYSVFRSHFPSDLTLPFIRHARGNAVTYSDVDQISAQFANSLEALGLSKGDRVAVLVEKSATALLLYLGCLRAGLVYLPLNTAYTESELAYFFTDAAPALVVCDSSRLEEVQTCGKKGAPAEYLTLNADETGTAVEHMQKQSHNHTLQPCAKSDLAAILYSSGTTGQPKGAMLSHGALAANAGALKIAWAVEPTDIVLHTLPIFHTHGLFVATNTVLIGGASLLLYAKFDPKSVVAALDGATIFMGVPTYYARLLKEEALTESACSKIRLFISGSAPLREETFNEFTGRTGHTIVERYGMTEAGIITSATLTMSRIAGTVGTPLESVSLRICDDKDWPVPDGEIGGVQIQGTSLFSGYWNKPEKTAEDFTDDNYFRTGDIGLIAPDGQLTLVDREKDMFISGGFNVFPKEIEQVLDTIDGIDESAVVGMPHPDFGEAGLAIVVADDTTFNEEQARTTLKSTLANYKVPKVIERVDSLPRNAMGKVQKNVLREAYKTTWEKLI